jgi:hypothetical protein
VSSVAVGAAVGPAGVSVGSAVSANLNA